jgi:RNA polymerase sigma-70 factor, ECF subfamily
MDEREDDDSLLAQIVSGDRHAFGRLMDRHADRVFALARSVIGSAADAEDVTQDVFLAVWRTAEDWRPGKARFTTWLYRVALNRSLNHKNRVARRQMPLDAVAEPADPAPNPDEALDAARRRESIDRAMADLPESQRTAMTLTYTVGLGNAEAATAMEISVKAFEALLVRARRRLRETLAPETLGGEA